MTGRLETMTEMVGQHALAELERRQRASAPTLRDLPAVTQAAAARENMTDVGNAGQSDPHTPKHH